MRIPKQINKITRLTVISKRNYWSLGFPKQNHSPNKTVAGASRGYPTMGYPRDAPATVLFGEWFRFGKPSNQTVNVQIEKSGTIFGFRGCASVPSESESTREDSQSILLEFNGEGGNWLKGFRGCASVPSESESTREEVYWCRRNGGESQC
ncbi:hypothetical protein LXL04_003790 [Taraxacum kok-saghyz]